MSRGESNAAAVAAARWINDVLHGAKATLENARNIALPHGSRERASALLRLLDATPPMRVRAVGLLADDEAALLAAARAGETDRALALIFWVRARVEVIADLDVVIDGLATLVGEALLELPPEETARAAVDTLKADAKRTMGEPRLLVWRCAIAYALGQLMAKPGLARDAECIKGMPLQDLRVALEKLVGTHATVDESDGSWSIGGVQSKKAREHLRVLARRLRTAEADSTHTVP